MQSSMLSTHTKQGCRSSVQALTTPPPETSSAPKPFSATMETTALAAHMPESVCDSWGTESVGEWQLTNWLTQIEKGNFEQFQPFQKGDVLYIEECELTYIYDTKGFYQPVYQFSGYINNKDHLWICEIPAVKMK